MNLKALLLLDALMEDSTTAECSEELRLSFILRCSSHPAVKSCTVSAHDHSCSNPLDVSLWEGWGKNCGYSPLRGPPTTVCYIEGGMLAGHSEELRLSLPSMYIAYAQLPANSISLYLHATFGHGGEENSKTLNQMLNVAFYIAGSNEVTS
ncbi:hypothetical protein BC938DRAFT_473922, partial [Jimgerdemannia flammicorona]